MPAANHHNKPFHSAPKTDAPHIQYVEHVGAARALVVSCAHFGSLADGPPHPSSEYGVCFRMALPKIIGANLFVVKDLQ